MREITKTLTIPVDGKKTDFRLTKLDAFSGASLLRILPCCERRSAYIAALKDCLVGLPRLCRLQQHGRIQGSLNVQVACHRIPGFVHSAQIAPGCRSRCPAGTTPGDRDCSVQLGTAMVDIPVRVNLHSIKALVFNPAFFQQRLAFGAMPVPAGIVGRPLVSAIRAFIHMAA